MVDRRRRVGQPGRHAPRQDDTLGLLGTGLDRAHNDLL
jgi:hypothetical protein